MNEEIMIMFDDDGVAREYKDEFDITIHCESKEKQEEVWKKLTQDDWIPISKDLPEENVPVLLGVKYRDAFKVFVTSRVDYNYWTGLGRDIKGEMRWKPLPESWEGERDDRS